MRNKRHCSWDMPDVYNECDGRALHFNYFLNAYGFDMTSDGIFLYPYDNRMCYFDAVIEEF